MCEHAKTIEEFSNKHGLTFMPGSCRGIPGAACSGIKTADLQVYFNHPSTNKRSLFRVKIFSFSVYDSGTGNLIASGGNPDLEDALQSILSGAIQQQRLNEINMEVLRELTGHDSFHIRKLTEKGTIEE